MNMAFTDTDYYKKSQYWQDNEGKGYYLVSPFGDGNCGLYAFACGLIDMIIMDKLILDAKKFSEFRKIISENFILNNLQNLGFKDLNAPFFDFSTLVQDELDFAEFKAFLIKQDRKDLAAINLLLAQPLRRIGLTQYSKLLPLDHAMDGVLLEEDIELSENNVCIGEDLLSSLADYFGIAIRLIGINDDSPTFFEAPLQEGVTPGFTMVNKLLRTSEKQVGHWHYAIFKNQVSGLAKVLPFSENKHPPLERRTSQRLLEDNKQLLQDIEKDFIKNDVTFSEANLDKLAEKLKQIFNYLKNIFSVDPEKHEFTAAARQANTAAKNSTEVLNTLRQMWSQHSIELDKRLDRLGLREIEKALIKGLSDETATQDVVDETATHDRAIATLLQNAEIADFLSRNYQTLTSRTPTFFTDVPTPTLNSSIRPTHTHTNPYYLSLVQEAPSHKLLSRSYSITNGA